MRVLQVHTRYRQPGGEDAVVRAEADLLRKAGHQVLTYEVANPSSTARTAVALAFAAWNPRAQDAVRRVVERYQPDVAHVHNTWYALSPAIFATLRRAHVPVVATLHNYRLLCTNGLLFRDGHPCQDCVGTHPWHGVQHRCYRGSATASAAVANTIAVHRARGTWERDVDLFLALTEFARQRFIAGGLPADKLRVKPNFVPDPGPRVCRPDESDTVLYVGRLSPEKGVAQLVHAWAAADPAPLRLRIIGDGPLRQQLANVAAPRVELLGPRPAAEVRHLMLKARALVFPSRWYETFGLVVVEAMAARLPVIASDIGGVAELLGDEHAEQLLPSESSAWEAGLRRLLDPSWLPTAGAEARRRYEARFSPEGSLGLLQGIYASVRKTVPTRAR